MSSTGITDAANVTATVSAGTVAATDLNTIDDNTTTNVAASAVTNYRLCICCCYKISTASNVAVQIDSGTAAATDLTTINTNTDAVVDGSVDAGSASDVNSVYSTRFRHNGIGGSNIIISDTTECKCFDYT